MSNNPQLIIQAISIAEFWEGVENIVKKQLRQTEEERQRPLTKKEAANNLGIDYKTLVKLMKNENIEVVYTSDIERLKLKYPKYARRNS